eukprot:754871-Hanusia_phi.AAC.2
MRGLNRTGEKQTKRTRHDTTRQDTTGQNTTGQNTTGQVRTAQHSTAQHREVEQSKEAKRRGGEEGRPSPTCYKSLFVCIRAAHLVPMLEQI